MGKAMTHDPDFYFEDGSVVLRAEDVEFKVRTVPLSPLLVANARWRAGPQVASFCSWRHFQSYVRDCFQGSRILGTAFARRTCWRLPQLSAHTLRTVSPRPVCSPLHSRGIRPDKVVELCKGAPTLAVAVQMLDVARISRLYNAVKIESLAVDQLCNFFDALAASSSTPALIPETFYVDIVGFLHKLDTGHACERLEAKLLAAIHKLDVLALLSACERFPKPASTLEGRAHAEALRRHAFPLTGYTQAQQTRLLIGYYRLSQEWHKFATVPPSMLLTAPPCETVQRAWAAALAAPSVQAKTPDDLLGRLDTMRYLLDYESKSASGSCSPGCKSWQLALELLDRRRAELAAGLRGFFFDAPYSNASPGSASPPQDGPKPAASKSPVLATPNGKPLSISFPATAHAPAPGAQFVFKFSPSFAGKDGSKTPTIERISFDAPPSEDLESVGVPSSPSQFSVP